VLDRFYDAMAAEIESAGGTVEKFAGDAVMAAFGAPSALEDHAERALHAALAMQRRLEPPLELRIGVNTGEVVVGRARQGSSFVTGDAVNVAARLEEAAAPGEILAGERTVAAARGAFEFDEPRTLQAKGKDDGVVGRRVIRALTLMRPRGVGGLHQAFVGRDTEIDLLRATYRRVIEHAEPHLVTIMGDAGIGKTRLVRELWQLLGEESPEPMRRTGRCLSYGHGITYWPVAEVLKEHFGILVCDSQESVLERLRGREILGLALGLDVGTDLHPLAARERLHEAAIEFFAELTSERPVVLLVEDLHWAEDELLELIDRLLLEVSGPLFLLGTSRPEILDTRPAWGGGRRNVSLLGLEPLSEQQTERMVSELLAAELPERVREALVERAGGNPFFVEELVGTLIDRGLLERSNGSWTARELPAGFEIPDSVQAVLAARIDLLPPSEKAALQAASVIGRIFWAGPVRELIEEAEPDFALLEERDFIRRRSGSSMLGEREFAIKHALTREVAYASLPKARRARLHAGFADWIERAGEARDEYAAILGHHYAEAVQPDHADLAWAGEDTEHEALRQKALHWLERAADLAVGR
jgi:predicted ATPase